MKQIVLMITLFCSLFSAYHKASALTINLPVSKTTQYWNVTLDKPIIHGENKYPKKDLLKEYSLTVKPLRKGLKDVEIEAFSDEKNSDKLYGLFSKEYSPSKYPFVFENLPVSNKAQNLIVQITWREEVKGRQFQQTFLFK